MTTSKIKEIHSVKEYNGQNGMVYYFDITMENGDRGNIGKKKKDAYSVGMSIDYTLEKTEKGNKIKEEVKAFWWKMWAGRDHKKDCVSFAMSYAKDLVVGGKIQIKDLSQYADKIYARMLSKL